MKITAALGLTTTLISFNAIALPNPAAVYCGKMGGITEVKPERKGMCTFILEDKEYVVGEWQFLRETRGQTQEHAQRWVKQHSVGVPVKPGFKRLR